MKLETIVVKRKDQTQHFHGSWWRGDSTNFLPNKASLGASDGIAEYVLKGFLPKSPVISKEAGITSFGSCFASHVTRFLRERGFRVLVGNDEKGGPVTSSSHIVRFGEGIVNTFAILQQLQWGFGERDFPEGLWYGPNKELAHPSAQARLETEDILKKTDVFIFTLGLSEIWYDKRTGDAFWRAIPAAVFDKTRHGFRVSSVGENFDNLNAIVELIKIKRPQAKVIFTLSPVPLMATFRPISCISANSVSKAVLRVALDELFRARGDLADRLYYFPSYELVKDVFADPFKDDFRHPKDEVISRIMEIFYRQYCAN